MLEKVAKSEWTTTCEKFKNKFWCAGYDKEINLGEKCGDDCLSECEKKGNGKIGCCEYHDPPSYSCDCSWNPDLQEPLEEPYKKWAHEYFATRCSKTKISTTTTSTSTVQPTSGMKSVTTTLSATEKPIASIVSNLSEDTTSVMDSISSDGLSTNTTKMIPISSIITTKGKRKQTKGSTGNVAKEPSDETIAGCLIALLSLAGSVSSAL